MDVAQSGDIFPWVASISNAASLAGVAESGPLNVPQSAGHAHLAHPLNRAHTLDTGQHLSSTGPLTKTEMVGV